MRLGERTLWITLSEAESERQQIASSHGWFLDGVKICNRTDPPRGLRPEEKYSFFSPADVELDQMRAAIFEAVDQHRPTRCAIRSRCAS